MSDVSKIVWPEPFDADTVNPPEDGDYLVYDGQYKLWTPCEWAGGKWVQTAGTEPLEITHWLPFPPDPFEFIRRARRLVR
jgi:hypothetical protein